MKNLLTLTLFLFGFAAASAQQVFHGKDYGIVPNTGTDMTQPFVKALADIKVKSDNKAILKLEAGDYDFYYDKANVRELYISNHDQDNPKNVAIIIEDLEDFTLDGGGASFHMNGRMLPIAMLDCEDCTLKNFSVDTRIPQISQVKVLENNASEGTITYEVAPYVQYKIENGRFIVYDKNWTLQPSWGIAFEGDTKRVVYTTSDIGLGTNNVEEVAPRTIRAPWKDARLIPGTVIAMRSYARPTPGIFLYGNDDTTLENVTIHYAEGMGLLAQICENITLNKFNVAIRANSGRYFTTQADATHFSGCKGKIVSVGGLYEGMMDDAINVHGTYLRIVKRLNNNTVVGQYMHGQAYGFYWGGEGDKVQFVNSNTMEVTEQNVVTDIEPYDKKELQGAKQFKITFKKPVSEDIANGQYGVENLEWAPKVYFADNVIRNNRARGALFSTPKKVVVERNLFDHTSGTAILLCGDCNGWFETGACRDVVIRNNHFVNALTSMFQFTNAVISIYPEIPNLKEQQKYFHGGKGHKGVVITNNVFETFDAPIVYAKSIDGLTFKNNKVIQNNDFKPFHWNKYRFLLERAINVKIKNNLFSNGFDEQKDIKYNLK
ncbi:MAG: alpha-1,3-galactosidase B [Bacteroidaceae bacterium]|nr:alpha-1,3-galactosidase B [Bacteroidaceae bacterium]